MPYTYDLIIIGAGPGGYVAAERAGALGKKVLLVEKSYLGGVCLNEGCIPSKTLLYSAKLFTQACHSEAFGVSVENPRFNLAKAMERKLKVILTLRKGIAYQMKHHKVEVVQGEAAFRDTHTVRVGDKDYDGAHFIIASGSSPIRPRIPGANGKQVLTSSEIFDIDGLPRNLAIIGGGVIGCEFASFFSHVGTNVSVIEMAPEILPFTDPELAVHLRKSMAKCSFQLGSKAEEISADSVTVSCQGKREAIQADLVLMAIGRTPNVRNMGLEAIGIDFDGKGIRVNDRMQTNIPHIHAVGDVNGLSMLAHSASRMGEVAVNVMFGKRDRMRYSAIPSVVYTYPEVASVGLTQSEASSRGIKVQVAKLPMAVSGRFLAENEDGTGFCQVVVDAGTKALLGVHMIGAYASEIIYGAAAMIEGEFRVQDIREIVFPHPTVAEVFKESLWAIPQS